MVQYICLFQLNKTCCDVISLKRAPVKLTDLKTSRLKGFFVKSFFKLAFYTNQCNKVTLTIHSVTLPERLTIYRPYMLSCNDKGILFYQVSIST